MEKAIGRFRQFSFFLVIATPFVLLLLIIVPRGELRNILPLPVFLQLQRILIPTVALSSWIFFPALLAIRPPTTRSSSWFVIRAVVLALGIPLCCILSYAFIIHSVPETINNSEQLGNHHYYLTITVDDFVSYDVYRCNDKDLECEVVFHELGERSVTPTALAVNQNSSTIDVYRNGQIIYTTEPEP